MRVLKVFEKRKRPIHSACIVFAAAGRQYSFPSLAGPCPANAVLMQHHTSTDEQRCQTLLLHVAAASASLARRRSLRGGGG